MTSLSKISPVSDFETELAFADDFDLALTGVAVIHTAQTEVVHEQKLHKDLLDVARREQYNRTLVMDFEADVTFFGRPSTPLILRLL